ncbi:MAG: HAD hydrolase-like protein [Phycisphaerae bacterium]|nr:HAD hydrolase-like protein [Phycisphaerae bacterium]
MTMITTVVFDLDDTLYDEVEYCKSGFTSVSEFLSNLPDFPQAEHIFDALWRQFNAGNHTKTFNAALNELGIDYDDKLIRQLIQVYRGHEPNITLPRQSQQVLSKLSEKFTLAILTDGFLPSQQLKVQALRIEQYFKCIIYTEQLGREFWKPSPAGFEKLIETLNVKSQSMAYVADNQMKDFIAPNRLGFTTIQIIRPARLHLESSQEPDSEAKYKISQISQLPPLLDKL